MSMRQDNVEAIRSTLETRAREDMLRRGVHGSVPVAVRHAYEAWRLGHCPRRQEQPWYRCLNGAMALIRMYGRMADRLGTSGSFECPEALDGWYEELLDLQEMG